MKIKSRFISDFKTKDDEQLMFEAGLQLSLTPYDGHSIKPLFLGIWPQTFMVIGGIYREAFALWRKGPHLPPSPLRIDMTQTTTEIKSLIVRESKDLTIAQKLARRGLLKGIFRRSIWTADHRRWRAYIFV
jgi:hypothetical protein